MATERPGVEHSGEGQIRLQLPCSEKKRALLSTLKGKRRAVGAVEVLLFLQSGVACCRTTFITLFYSISTCLSLKGKLSPEKGTKESCLPVEVISIRAPSQQHA